MRRVFLGLLLLNLALFGWLHGVFGDHLGGREPFRLEKQIAADRIRVLTDEEAKQVEKRARDQKAAAAASAAAAATAQSQEPVGPCVQIGEFASQAELLRLRERLAILKLSDRASEQTRERPGWYLVYLPPEKTLAAAEERVRQLREQGLPDLLVVREGGLRFAIGVGSFRDRELARKQVALLERRGVTGARITDAPTTAQSTRVLIRGVDPASVRQLEELTRKEFPQQRVQACGPES
ncbi:MAG: SPOR domain-containing protein [Burkholderiaceae bacterium]|nr:SPOR domain-containing protein [Burkholderiaceae bacterium]